MMKTKLLRRGSAWLLALALAFSLAAPGWAADPEPGTTEPGTTQPGGSDPEKPGTDTPGSGTDKATLTLSATEMIIVRDNPQQADQLTATVTPESRQDEVKWEVKAGEDGGKVSLDQNTGPTVKLTGDSRGTATVIAKIGDEAKAECQVTILVPLTEVNFAESGNTQFDSWVAGSTERTLDVITSPATSRAEQGQYLRFSSADETIATIDQNGRVKPVSPGEVEVTVSSQRDEDVFAKRTVVVSGLKPKPAGTVLMGRSINLEYDAFGAAKGGNITWTSTNNSVLYVSGGRATGRAEGTAVITATSSLDNSYKATWEITVRENTAGMITSTATAGQPFAFSDILSKLNTICQESSEKGASLKYITNLNVPTDQGILYYHYVSANDTGYGVGGTEDYYYSDSVKGKRSISGITFVPKADFSGTANITYMGYDTNNDTYSGTIRLTVDGVNDVSYTVASGEAAHFQANDFTNLCRLRTGRELSYVMFDLPDSARGTLYYNYTGQAAYAEKVSASTQYFRTRSPYLDTVSFVPASTYTGNVRIGYRAVDTAGTAYSGRVSVTVTNKKDVGAIGDVTFKASNTGDRVAFSSSRFQEACRDALGETLDYVRFTLPSSSEGTLYYNYRTNGGYDSRVSANTKYYRSGTPSIGTISFVPASTASEQVTIQFTGYSTEGNRFDGTVVIRYPTGSVGDGVLTYSTAGGRAVEFDSSSFNSLCQDISGRSLNYVVFKNLPSSSRGTLYYNYTSAASRGSTVTTNTRLYRNGSPSLSRVAFVPNASYAGAVTFSFLGYDSSGYTFDGTVRIEVEAGSHKIEYSVRPGGFLLMEAADFNSASQAATGSNVNYIQFELPSSSRGTLYYKYDQAKNTYGSKVTASTSYYRTGANRLIDDVTFAAAETYNGTVNIPYTAWSTNSQRFTGTVEIEVSTPAADTIRYTTASLPVQMQASDFRRVCNAALGRELSYVQFTGLPDSSAGRLYFNYSGLKSGSQVSTGSSYYCNQDPSLSKLSFVPKAGYQGTVTLSYVGVDGSGERVSGTVSIGVSTNATGVSSRFNDMSAYLWAGPAVEFLSQNGVVSGVNSTQYGPGQSIRRGDFVLMLCRAFGFTGSETYSFQDVPQDSYYAQAIATAKGLGIVNGGDGGRFRPEGSLSRQDAMVMLSRAMQVSGWSLSGETDLSPYGDSGQISSYARSAVASMVQMGVVAGDQNRNLNPRGNINRAEMAVILHRVLTL